MEESKLNLESVDIAAKKQAELLRLFPEASTEGGKIDFDQLKRALGEIVDTGKERYGMSWPGKAECFRAIQSPSTATLLPVREESVSFDETENLIIEGDNLEVLKLLQKGYQGAVKMIYIDPPYNTGQDFIYPDDYADSLKNYLQFSGQADAKGKSFSNNLDTDGRFHSKWLNMMYPRLYLARNLMRDDGVIFISIDDAEATNLKNLCNLVFGESNFVELIIWKKRNGPPNDKVIGADHDYILIYAKDIDQLVLNLRQRSDEQIARYKNPDNHPKGPWVAGDLSGNVKGGRYVDSLNYVIKNPHTGEEHRPPGNGNWRFNKEKMAQLIASNEIHFGEDGRGKPKLKRFLADVKDGVSYPTIWDFVPFNTQGSTEMESILGYSVAFESPKPSGLLLELISLGSGPDDTILDFFAGSGTTGHSTIEANRRLGGNRKFILIQLPEPTGREDYRTIAEITKERVRRVIQRQQEQAAGQLSLQTVGTGRRKEGFRVFKLAPSNFKVWDAHTDGGVEALEQQLELAVHNVRQDRHPEDLLYEILLKSEFPLTAPVDRFDAAGIEAFSVKQDDMIVCVAQKVTDAAIAAIAARKPLQVVFLDEAFSGNDQLKKNARLNFEAAGVTRFQTI